MPSLAVCPNLRRVDGAARAASISRVSSLGASSVLRAQGPLKLSVCDPMRRCHAAQRAYTRHWGCPPLRECSWFVSNVPNTAWKTARSWIYSREHRAPATWGRSECRSSSTRRRARSIRKEKRSCRRRSTSSWAERTPGAEWRLRPLRVAGDPSPLGCAGASSVAVERAQTRAGREPCISSSSCPLAASERISQ